MNNKEILERIGNAIPILSKLEKSDLTADWAKDMKSYDCNFSIDGDFGPGSWCKDTFSKKRLDVAIILPITLKQFLTVDYWEGQDSYCPHWAYLTITSKGYATFCIEHRDGGIALSPELEWKGRVEKIVDKVIEFYGGLTVTPTQEISSWQQDEIDKLVLNAPGFSGITHDHLVLVNYACLDGIVIANFRNNFSIPYTAETSSLLYLIGGEGVEQIYKEMYYKNDEGSKTIHYPNRCIATIVSAKPDHRTLLLQYKDVNSKDDEIRITFSQDQRKSIVNLIGKVLVD